MSLHSGPASLLDEIEEDLLNFIREWRQKGFKVNCFSLLRKAYELNPKLREHSEPAGKMCLSQFLARNNLTFCTSTHKAQ